MTRLALFLLGMVVLAAGCGKSARAQVAQEDSLALVALYTATDGPNWTDNTNWLSGTVASWIGVTLEGNRVTALVLPNNALDGTLPPEIGNLGGLQRLLLFRNRLSGEIPPEIGNLAKLDELILARNRLNGEIPPEIGNLASLQTLDLFLNLFTGAIPPELGNLTNLEVLFLHDNQLDGALPPEIGVLENLQILNLSRNQFSGALPPELGALARLRLLDTSFNQFTGEIPPELGRLGRLEILWLLINPLTGEIPPELGDLASLESLLINRTQLTGDIPLNFINLTRLRVFNFISTDLCEPSDDAFQNWLQSVPDVSSNGLTCTPTATEEAPTVPTRVGLDANYPNPFHRATRISYTLPHRMLVRLAVYDATGRLVEVLVETNQPAGRQAVTFETSTLPSGVYFYRLDTGAFRETRPMLLLR